MKANSILNIKITWMEGVWHSSLLYVDDQNLNVMIRKQLEYMAIEGFKYCFNIDHYMLQQIGASIIIIMILCWTQVSKWIKYQVAQYRHHHMHLRNAWH